MYKIQRYKIAILSCLFMLTSSMAFSQTSAKGNYNFWEFSNKPFYFGLTAGLHSAGFIVNKSSQFASSDSISFIQGVSKPGINLNIITNLKIGQHFDFRFIPGFAYSERRIRFGYKFKETTDEVSIESLFFEAPLLLRFKSDPYKDKRIYVMTGLKYSYDVSSNSKTRQAIARNLFQISPHDFQFEVGAGLQFFLPFFIFSPEIKFSQGLSNIHVYNSNLEKSRAIDKILSRAFSISFHFEG